MAERHRPVLAGTGRRAGRAGRARAAADRASCCYRATLESFILRDQAEDLLTAPGVVAVEPARISYGAYLRLPASVGDGLAAAQARRLRLPGVPRAIVIFHPLQYPLARGLIAQHPDARALVLALGPLRGRLRRARRASATRLEDLHLAASLRAAVNVVVSDALGEFAREESGEPVLVPLAADSFPAPDPRRPSSPSRSATSATARTGRCCAPSPSACRSSCCC